MTKLTPEYLNQLSDNSVRNSEQYTELQKLIEAHVSESPYTTYFCWTEDFDSDYTELNLPLEDSVVNVLESDGFSVEQDTDYEHRFYSLSISWS